jgi:two-component system, OmpR family, response regulator
MNDNGHILVVDDERDICDLVQVYLSGEGYRVSIAQDGAGMRGVMAQSPVDLVILDLRLPGEDGLTLARWLRENFRVGIIMLTGRGEIVDHILSLEMGADYFVRKPYHNRHLLATVRSVLRRPSTQTTEEQTPPRSKARFPGWELDLSSRELFSALGKGVRLTTGEFDLLAGVRQQPKSGVEPGPATRSLPQSQSRAARSDDRRPGRPTSEQARRRPERADDDQDGARARLHLHPRGRVVLAAGPPGLLSGTAPTRRYSIGASDWCARGVTAGRRI